MGTGNTTPPDRFTPELEAMIAVMSGDLQSARQWLARLSAQEREALRVHLATLDGLLAGMGG
ncbi:hypothetical protein [Streptomyces sp. NPDC046925]|uniref:hypothetical protein n=1 Tax=Streptomyces sp. NPDC046925 TaxID=3155375 RepID=UPI0033CB75B9